LLLVAALAAAGCSRTASARGGSTRAHRAAHPGHAAESAPQEPPPSKDERASAKSEPAARDDASDKGGEGGRHRRKGLLSERAAGPVRLGMRGSEALALPGASRGAGDCACDYSVQLKSLGLEASVSGDEVCEIVVHKRGLATAEGLGVGSRYGEFEARYGEGIGEDATGMTGFERMPLFVGFEDAEPQPSTKITSIRIGGCGE